MPGPWRFLAAGVALSFVVSAAACSGNDSTSGNSGSGAASGVNAARADLCDSLDGLKGALEDVTSLSGDSTIDDVKEARNNVEKAFDAVVDAGGALVQAGVAVIRTAYDALVSAFDDVPAGQKLGDAASTIESKAKPVVDTVNSSLSDLACH
jgi:hypothetical protein